MTKCHVIGLFVFCYYIGLIVGAAGTFWIAKTHFSQLVDTENGTVAIFRTELSATREKLQEKSSFSEMLKGNLSKCDAEKGLLESERTTLKTELEEISLNDSKCHFAWRFFNNFCYYYQGFTKDAQGNIMKYDWRTAESNCVFLGGHLISIHSRDELNFMKKLITPEVDMKLLNARALPQNPCKSSQYYVWNGLYNMNGTRKLSDGSADDYHGIGKGFADDFHYMFCNDDSNENSYQYYEDCHLHNIGSCSRYLNARYVCKKAANK